MRLRCRAALGTGLRERGEGRGDAREGALVGVEGEVADCVRDELRGW
jgi:hypothetical protein